MLDSISSSSLVSLLKRRPDWWGWATTVAGSVVLAISWWPGLWYPLGDSSEGRILARLGIQARNFWEMGAAASGWGTNLTPYAETYAHHPPLTNMAQILVYGLAGEGEAQLRVFGYLAGFFTLWALIILLRRLGVSWAAALLAVGALASTTFFWAFGRLGGGFSISVGFLAAVAHLRSQDEPSRRAVGIASLLGAASVLLSWPGAAVAALGGIWLLMGRGWDRSTKVVAAVGVATAAAMAMWILSATDIGELADQARSRSNTDAFTWAQFLDKQWSYASRLLPGWYLWLVIPSLVAGFWHRQIRPVMAISGVVALAWTLGPQEGAFNHEFWNLNWFLPLTVGLAALIDLISGWLRRLHSRGALIPVAVASLLLVGALWGLVGATAFRGGADAGELLDRNEPPAGQTTVWVASNIAAPRWAAWYWDLPVTALPSNEAALVPDDALVLVRIADSEEWLAKGGTVTDQVGTYALIPGSQLVDH